MLTEYVVGRRVVHKDIQHGEDLTFGLSTLSCQPRVAVTSYCIYKVIRIGLIHKRSFDSR